MYACMRDRQTETEMERQTENKVDPRSFALSLIHSPNNHLLRFCFLPVVCCVLGMKTTEFSYHLLLSQKRQIQTQPTRIQWDTLYNSASEGAQCFPRREESHWGAQPQAAAVISLCGYTNCIPFPGAIIMQIPNFLQLKAEF